MLTDLHMQGMSGLELCERIVANRPDIPVVVITAFGSLETAVGAIRAGAYDFITKPVELDALVLTLERAVQHRALRDEVQAPAPGASAEAQALERARRRRARRCGRSTTLIDRVAETDATVLITGESGTGKELVARGAPHARAGARTGRSSRSTARPCPSRCSRASCSATSRAPSPTRKAPRTGLFVAGQRRHALPRRDRRACRSALQPKLLRALQERKVRPVGGDDEVPFDARIVAATNRDLETAVEERRFREDLYYRINVVHIDAAAAARARQRRAAARAALPRAASPRAAGKTRARASRAPAAREAAGLRAGPATCASCRTASSARSRSTALRADHRRGPAREDPRLPRSHVVVAGDDPPSW